jgi:hypothetical protein
LVKRTKLCATWFLCRKRKRARYFPVFGEGSHRGGPCAFG